MAEKRPRSNEVSELENAFHNLAERNAAKKSAQHARSIHRRNTAIIIACSLLLVAALLIGGWFLYQYLYDNTVIHSKLTVAGVDVSGMTRVEAEKAVADATGNAYAYNTMTVWIDDHVVRIPYSASGISVDVEAAVDAAIAYEQTGTEQQSLDITTFMTVNKEAIMAQLSQFSEHYTSILSQSTYEVIGEAPNEVVTPDETTVLPTIRITIGTPGMSLDLEDLYQHVLDAYNECVFGVEYTVNYTAPDALDLNAIYTQISLAPVDAQMDPETFEITGGFHGYDFDVEAASIKLERAKFGEVIEIPLRWVEPENTAEELSAVLFRDTLASYTTRAGSIYDRNINLKLACQAINGMILYPGDVFSYNEALGERTTEKGYRPGVSYIGGQSVMDIGGGICQVSSTLYYCTVVADLEIVERWNHAYASSYTPLGTDASVFWGGIDFKFKNNTDYPIRIEAYSSYGNVTVKLIGTDTKDYYVKFVSERLKTIPYSVEYKEFEADNEKGYKDGDILTSPYTGYVSKSYRVKYDKETNKKLETILENHDSYGSRNQVVVKIIGGTDTDDPSNPDSGSTDSGSTDSGSTDSGSTDSGSTDSGSTDSGSTDSGSTDSGSTDSGSTDSGSGDSGSGTVTPPADDTPAQDTTPPADSNTEE